MLPVCARARHDDEWSTRTTPRMMYDLFLMICFFFFFFSNWNKNKKCNRLGLLNDLVRSFPCQNKNKLREPYGRKRRVHHRKSRWFFFFFFLFHEARSFKKNRNEKTQRERTTLARDHSGTPMALGRLEVAEGPVIHLYFSCFSTGKPEKSRKNIV